VRFANALAWHCRELALGLLQAGHEVFVLTQRDSPLAAWLEQDGIRHDATANPNRTTPSEIFRTQALFRQKLHEFHPDVLNPHCPPGHFFLSLNKKRDVPGAVLVRTVGEPRPPKSNFINRWLHEKSADSIIVTCSASQQRYLRAFSLRPEQVPIIYPGFDGEGFRQYIPLGDFRQRYGIEKGALLAGVVARLSPEKGHRPLLEAFAPVSHDFPSVKLIVAGPNAREQTAQDLKEFAHALGISDKVIFTGRIEDVREVMAELSLGLIPSLRSEAICRVALEYMTWGIPIIATDVNILPDIVRDGRNGWIFPAGDSEALSKTLRHALSNENERRRRGDEGKRMVLTEFTRARMLEKTLAVYQEAGSART
jgi:glycosyltransferase involved in cell wall biosynthesis